MEEEFDDSDDDDEECILNTNYNISMLQVHRNPTIILDDRAASTLALQVPRYSDQVYREEDEVMRFQEENSDDEEDEITDYIGSVEVHSGSGDSPASQGRGTLSCSPREPGELLTLGPGPGDGDSLSSSDQSDSGHGGEDTEGIAGSLGLIRISEQDTISDESGYSEEPGAMREVSVVRVNITSEPPPMEEEEVFIPGSLMSPHKLEIQCNDSSNNNNTSHDQKLSSHRNSWCQPINIEIDSVADSASQYDSQESSPRDTSSADASPPLPAHAQMSPEERPLSPNVILTPGPPREGALPSPRVTDLSVKSVFLSEFTATEKLRYIDRSSVKNAKNAMVLNRQEFCINI